MKLNILTFGNFDIRDDEQSLLKEASRTYRLYKLFQYFLTFRNKKLLPETIIENLWQDNESNDPKNMLRAQIFRLRQLIKSMLPDDVDESLYLSINFTNGYYCMEIGDRVTLDIEEFEDSIKEGDKNRFIDVGKSIECYKKAIHLYNGAYLSENSYEVWLVPIRNYYSRIYLKTLFKLIEMLKEKEYYEAIIEICEEAIIIEPYEEVIHIYIMESMLKLGQIKNALSHYDYISVVLEKEMGVKSSSALRDVYRKIQESFEDKGEVDIQSIEKKLEDNEPEGALLCDSDYFKFLYNMQKRKSLREENSDIMSLITYNGKNKKDADELNKWTKIMTQVLESSLRKGDAFCIWNETQILVMLHEVMGNGLEKIENRIKRNYQNSSKGYAADIIIKFLPMKLEESLI